MCKVHNRENQRQDPVIAGTGSNCTKTAMELSKEAAGYGADGVLVVTPYYNKATQKGMIAHFTQVAEAAKVPVVLYNIPGRSGCKMEQRRWRSW